MEFNAHARHIGVLMQGNVHVGVVNHVVSAPNGVRCTRCGHSPMQRARMLWMQFGGNVGHGMSGFCAPPDPPRWKDDRRWARNLFVASIVGCAVPASVVQIAARPGDPLALAAWACIVPLIAGWLFVTMASWDKTRNDEYRLEYEAYVDLWERRWVCTACGWSIVETRQLPTPLRDLMIAPGSDVAASPSVPDETPTDAPPDTTVDIPPGFGPPYDSGPPS